MNAHEITIAKAYSDFKDEMERRIAAKNWTTGQFLVRAFGGNEKGQPKWAGPWWTMTRGYRRPTDQTMITIAKALDEEPAVMLALRDKLPLEILQRKPPTAAKPSQKSAEKSRQVSALIRPVAPPSVAVPVPAKEPDQFSLQIDQAGRATLRVNLIDVPMATAMRAMAALTSAGILNSGDTEGR